MHKSALDDGKMTRRTVLELDIRDASSRHFSDEHSYFLNGVVKKEDFIYYDVHIKATGFVRRQVTFLMCIMTLIWGCSDISIQLQYLSYVH